MRDMVFWIRAAASSTIVLGLMVRKRDSSVMVRQ